MINIPPGLKEAIEADDLVLFIGAGLSWDLKNTDNESLEGWDKMVKSITSHLKEKGYITDELKQSCDALEPIKVLEKLENKGITKREVGGFVKHYFALGEGNDFSFQQKLFSLSTKIITTNYDRAFEKAIPELQEIKAYRTKDYELNRLKKDPIFLFKLHGCIDGIDSMVLLPSDYDKLYKSKGREAEHALYALRNLIFNKTFLFIGTGLGDPQINGIFKEINRIQGIYDQEHYIITDKPLENSLNFLTSIEVASYTEIPEVIKQLLDFKEDAEAKKSSQEKMLLEQLKESEEEVISLTEELDKEKRKNKRQSLLLEREAKNHFNIGLKHHLAGEYLDASKEYKAATELKLEFHEAYNNWGLVLSELAQTKSGIETETLYNESFEKYHYATQLKPDYHEAYNNWGNGLNNLALTRSGVEAEALYKDSFEKYHYATQLKPDDHKAYYNWGNALSNLAQTKFGVEAEALYKDSFEKYHQATQLKPDDYKAYNNWGNALKKMAQTKSGVEAEALYKDSFEKYHHATQLKPDGHEAYYNWGNALSDFAQTKFDVEAEALYKDSFEKYHQATQLKPDDHEAYYNWGNALSELAQTKSGVEAEALYKDSFEKYHYATQLKPDAHEAYYNWGFALALLAQTKSGVEAEALYKDSFEKYHQATQLKPDDHEAYYNWGNALSNLAQAKSGIEAEALYKDSFVKYRQATQIKPDCHEAYNNWGVALTELAQIKSGSEAEKLYNEAFEKFLEAVKNGGSSYNLACLYAIRNKKEEALKYLERSLSRREASVEKVEKDKGWDGLRDDSDFKRILSNTKG
ncbi:SIR2 family protein [Prevotella intermedia]|uniref:SIR2 family protein n=1 Tax=Prevotella intermedia TaxID=28131 RepID=UPI000B4C7114|nr:SIR2 family protein [Prevotella intermedia]OWP33479.1 SIR2 family protein [Prevotella intermedia]